jgi:hypothetical protein
MAALKALTIVKISGVTSFNVEPGYFYRVDTSSGDVDAKMPSYTTTTSSDWCIIKKSSSDAHVVNATPYSGEKMNGSSSPNTLSGYKQSHMFMPNTPSFFGSGWMSW